MLGQLINDFDNAEDNTLKAFNDTFKTQLLGNSDELVTIGVIQTGGFRTIWVGNKKHLLDLKQVPQRKESLGRAVFHYHVKKEGEDTKIFGTIKGVSDYLGLASSVIANHVTRGGSLASRYEVVQVLIGNAGSLDSNGKVIKPLKDDVRKITQQAVYTIDVNDVKSSYRTVKAVADFRGLKAPTARQQLKKHNTIDGCKVTVSKLTDEQRARMLKLQNKGFNNGNN